MQRCFGGEPGRILEREAGRRAEQVGLEALRQGGNLCLIQSARHRSMELCKEQEIKLVENKLIKKNISSYVHKINNFSMRCG